VTSESTRPNAWGDPERRPADLVLTGARVLTLAAAPPRAEGLAARDGRIVALGRAADLRPYVGPRTEVLDLRGKVVLPGFVDAHNHLLWAGLSNVRPALGDARSVADLLAVVAEAAAARPPGEWIVSAPAWHITALREGRHPTRAELDRVAPANPVYLNSNSHDAAVNSLALRLCGIDASTADPAGGSLDRDPTSGEPTGVLREGPALWLVERHLPPPRADEYVRAVESMAQRYLAAGLTSVLDPALTPAEMRAYFALWREGRLPLRTTMMLRLDAQPGLEAALALLGDWGVASGFGDDWLRLGGVKVFLDGAISKGAAMMEVPYPASPHPQGIQAKSDADLRAIVRQAHAHGWQVGVHSSGDRAVRVLLDCYAAAHAEASIADRRFQVIHAHLMRPADRQRARALGVVVVPQPAAVARGAWAESVLGAERASQAWPLRSYLDAGLTLAGGTDAPLYPYQPLYHVWAAVARQVEETGRVHAPEQRLSRLEALRLFTSGGAYATFDEHRKGTLEIGKLADAVVLADDPLTCPEADLRDLPVLLTVVGGRVAYRSPALD
jgi:predicted amidohydrolase YtcJ